MAVGPDARLGERLRHPELGLQILRPNFWIWRRKSGLSRDHSAAIGLFDLHAGGDAAAPKRVHKWGPMRERMGPVKPAREEEGGLRSYTSR